MNDTPSIHPLSPQTSSEPTPLFGSEVDSFVQQLRLAAQAHRAGRLDEAISSYLRLLSVKPYHAELHNNLGVALRLVGKLDASVSACRWRPIPTIPRCIPISAMRCAPRTGSTRR